MNNKKIVVASIIGLIVAISLSYAGYQYFIYNKGWFNDQILTPLSEEKEAFSITDLPVEETRKFPLEIIAVKPNADELTDINQVYR